MTRPIPAEAGTSEGVGTPPEHTTGGTAPGGQVVRLRDPQQIAGAAVAKYGAPLAVSVACEIASLADYIFDGPAAERRRIPDRHITAARKGIAEARQVLAQAAEARNQRETAERTPPPPWPTRGGGA